MEPLVQDADFTLYVGDVRAVLAELPDESVQCVVTSPPYWGLRDYGTGSWEGGDPDCDHEAHGRTRNDRGSTGLGGGPTAGSRDPISLACKCGAHRIDQQLGLEPTPSSYVENMVAVFREVRRVLRKDGTLWLNIGDSYAGSGPSGASYQSETTKRRAAQKQDGNFRLSKTLGERGLTYAEKKPVPPPGLKPKDLCGIPWRLAFALQADGWYLRAEIIWAKPNPMPESVTDRPTKSHEQVFLFTRSPRYFYDADAVREPAEWARWGDQTNAKHEGSESAAGWIGSRTKAELTPREPRGKALTSPRNDGNTWNEANGRGFIPNQAGRNLRSVWSIATQPYAEAHFATYPEELVRRCILAGTSEKGCCPECGAPWERETKEATGGSIGQSWHDHSADERRGNAKVLTSKGYQRGATTGWRTTCDHYKVGTVVPTPIAPCVVLDPFLGSGTTALVARKHGRHCIGIELNEKYAEMAARRLSQQSLLAEGAT